MKAREPCMYTCVEDIYCTVYRKIEPRHVQSVGRSGFDASHVNTILFCLRFAMYMLHQFVKIEPSGEGRDAVSGWHKIIILYSICSVYLAFLVRPADQFLHRTGRRSWLIRHSVLSVGDQVLLKLQPYTQSSVANPPFPKLSFKYFGLYKVRCW